jgi:hypothetical protein
MREVILCGWPNAERSHAAPELLAETQDLRIALRTEAARADAGWAQSDRLAAALRRLIERHEEETNGGTPISGEEWEIASYALPRVDSDA